MFWWIGLPRPVPCDFLTLLVSAFPLAGTSVHVPNGTPHSQIVLLNAFARCPSLPLHFGKCPESRLRPLELMRTSY